MEVNTLNLCYEELKLIVEELRKRDIKHHSHLTDLDNKNKKIQDEMRKGLEELEKQIKVLQVEMLNGLSNNQKMP
ncbi:MAG: hypothetical protein E6Q39_03005 [Crocinitomicaceae bacterium]|nr:MAG: hypothetical protein E6Q39_03005 [Crocinitomicaceae bacterium]